MKMSTWIKLLPPRVRKDSIRVRDQSNRPGAIIAETPNPDRIESRPPAIVAAEQTILGTIGTPKILALAILRRCGIDPREVTGRETVRIPQRSTVIREPSPAAANGWGSGRVSAEDVQRVQRGEADFGND